MNCQLIRTGYSTNSVTITESTILLTNGYHEDDFHNHIRNVYFDHVTFNGSNAPQTYNNQQSNNYDPSTLPWVEVFIKEPSGATNSIGKKKHSDMPGQGDG